jgi:hypothetical protein
MRIPAPPIWLLFGVTVVFWIAVGLHFAHGCPQTDYHQSEGDEQDDL